MLDIKYLVAVFFLYSSLAAHSQIRQSDIPAELADTTRGRLLNSLHVSENFGAYLYFDQSEVDQRFRFKYLFNYQLSDQSFTRFSGVDTFGSFRETNQLDGSLWVLANSTLDLNDSLHQFTVYGEQAGGGRSRPLELFLNNDDLFSGGGFRSFSFGSSLFFETDEGDLVDGKFPCLSTQCSFSTAFNTVGFEYEISPNNGPSTSLASIVLDLDDIETLIFSESSGSPNQFFGTTDRFSAEYRVNLNGTISDVPLPASLWFLVSGLSVLLLKQSKQKTYLVKNT